MSFSYFCAQTGLYRKNIVFFSNLGPKQNIIIKLSVKNLDQNHCPYEVSMNNKFKLSSDFQTLFYIID